MAYSVSLFAANVVVSHATFNIRTTVTFDMDSTSPVCERTAGLTSDNSSIPITFFPLAFRTMVEKLAGRFGFDFGHPTSSHRRYHRRSPDGQGTHR